MSIFGSFRLRFALLSTLPAGLVFIAFTAWTWATVQWANLSDIDGELVRIASGEELNKGQLVRLEEVWELIYHKNSETEQPFLAMLVVGWDKTVFAQSPAWPEELDISSWPDPLATPRNPGPPGGRPGAGLASPQPMGGGPPNGPRYGEGLPMPRGQAGGGVGAMGGAPVARQSGFIRSYTWNGEGQKWRIGLFNRPDVVVGVAIDMRQYQEQNRQILFALLGAMLVGMLVLSLAGYFFAQRALQPIRDLGSAAERISVTGLDERISLSGSDAEFQHVINLFNGMMDRLERSFSQATRFTADASHELRTPLTILQGRLEEGIQSAPSGSEEQKRYGALLEEVQRLKAITNKLLTLSLADAGQLRLSKRVIDLSRMVEDTCEDLAILAPHLEIEIDIPENVFVSGDPDLLRQVVQNLANNAIRYNLSDGRVRLILKKNEKEVRLSVSNTSKEIPPEQAKRIFERFYRVDEARGREGGGAGLGLNLASEIARVHGGKLILEPYLEDMNTFTLVIPVSESEEGEKDTTRSIGE